MNKTLVFARWLLILLIIGSAVLAAITAVRLWQAQQVNAYINEPEAFEVVPDDPRARFAYAGWLESQQKHDEALDQLTQILGEADSELLPWV